jgi:microcompartment protein CcmL/EutN
MSEAIGILEVFGLTTAFVAADAGCKAANVRLEVFDKNKPGNADALAVPLIVAVKYRGAISDVKAAMEAGKTAANTISGVVTSHIIAKPEQDSEKLFKISALDKN